MSPIDSRRPSQKVRGPRRAAARPSFLHQRRSNEEVYTGTEAKIYTSCKSATAMPHLRLRASPQPYSTTCSPKLASLATAASPRIHSRRSSNKLDLHTKRDAPMMSTKIISVIRRCPECGERLTVRENRRRSNLFIGCSRYPKCTFTESFSVLVQKLGKRIVELERKRTEATSHSRDVLLAPLVRELRQLIFRFHPDRHFDDRLAHEITSELTRVRDLVQAQR